MRFKNYHNDVDRAVVKTTPGETLMSEFEVLYKDRIPPFHILAKKIGIKTDDLKKIIKGKKKITRKISHKICTAWGPSNDLDFYYHVQLIYDLQVKNNTKPIAKEISRLISIDPPPSDTHNYESLQLLVLILEKYENKFFPL